MQANWPASSPAAQSWHRPSRRYTPRLLPDSWWSHDRTNRSSCSTKWKRALPPLGADLLVVVLHLDGKLDVPAKRDKFFRGVPPPLSFSLTTARDSIRFDEKWVIDGGRAARFAADTGTR